MNTPDPAAIPMIESGAVFAPASTLDFTRSSFRKDGRVHIESCCNQCGLRIAAKTSPDFDVEEREHAATCEGSHAE
jgi:hypothetical protein